MNEIAYRPEKTGTDLPMGPIWAMQKVSRRNPATLPPKENRENIWKDEDVIRLSFPMYDGKKAHPDKTDCIKEQEGT